MIYSVYKIDVYGFFFCLFVEFLISGSYFIGMRLGIGNVRFYRRGVLLFSLDGVDSKNWIFLKKFIGIDF